MNLKKEKENPLVKENIRLFKKDVEKAKLIAQEKGVSFNHYVRFALKDKVAKDSKEISN